MNLHEKFPFFESIRLLDGRFYLLEEHFARMKRTLKGFYNVEKELITEDYLNSFHPPFTGLFKCRLSYGLTVGKPEFIPYFPIHISTLKLVYTQNLDYHYKYNDRQRFQALFNLRGLCQDVLIVNNGFITDTSICNIAFFDGKEWLTPKNPLLCGVQRDYLLRNEVVRTKEIRPSDLGEFSCFKLFNAMMPWELAPEINSAAIR